MFILFCSMVAKLNYLQILTLYFLIYQNIPLLEEYVLRIISPCIGKSSIFHQVNLLNLMGIFLLYDCVITYGQIKNLIFKFSILKAIFVLNFGLNNIQFYPINFIKSIIYPQGFSSILFYDFLNLKLTLLFQPKLIIDYF